MDGSEFALRGQGEDYARLLNLARARKLPHALVIEGGRGTGKSTAAKRMAAALLGDGDVTTAARISSGNHPDLYLLAVPEDKTEIPVESVRELIEKLQMRPMEGGARVAIVDPADRLNEQGQNALLKTLEEPGEDAFLILVVDRPEALLDTVRSRCARLRIRALGTAHLAGLLRADPAIPAADVQRAIDGCGGSLGLARRLLDPDLRPLSRAIETFLLAPGPVAVRPAAEVLCGSGTAGRAANDERARLVLFLLRSRLRIQLDGALAASADDGYLSARTESCLTALDAVLAAEADLDLGIPQSQVIEGLLLRLCGSSPLGGQSA
ncbi:MAG: DNA/RNA helicase domain-containing protein [Planctomycetota bacterium]